MTAVPPFKESSRELIVEVARALEPYFPDITNHWRDRLVAEFGFDGRTLAALERLTLAAGCSYFIHNDFPGFQENLQYFGTRLSKLQVDTRAVARSLELYSLSCDPYLSGLFPDREAEAKAALEMLSSVSFVIISGAYFDAQTLESQTLLAVLDAELAAGDLKALLQKVLEITTQTFQASVGAMMLRDGDNDHLKLCSEFGLGQRVPENFQITIGKGFSGNIAASGEPGMILDTSVDHGDFTPIIRSQAKSLWGVPLKADGITIGVLVIGFPKPYEWLPTERELLRAIGDRAALAIERARMTEALREREQRIAELSAHLLRVQEEERKRISRELHDETGQALMVIRLYLGMMESGVTQKSVRGKIKETVEVVDRTIEGIRRIIGKLSPLVLQELGLVAAIRKEAKDLAKSTGVKARVLIADDVGRLAPGTEQAIYRVVQEALHNISKHAKAQNVTVQVEREEKQVHVLVEDDGIGIQGQGRANSRERQTFGLAGMKERIAMLGGVSRVISTKGKGTRIEITVPAGEPASPVERPPQRAAMHAGVRPN
ncbi:MAG TPA: GAF domain-containing sensor histidine kinase [Candidatus Limnocylindrales bacterium]|nr:GAF domain-containing sensor histidine kinase [Candidatus Limnocylindrales bacterium]